MKTVTATLSIKVRYRESKSEDSDYKEVNGKVWITPSGLYLSMPKGPDIDLAFSVEDIHTLSRYASVIGDTNAT